MAHTQFVGGPKLFTKGEQPQADQVGFPSCILFTAKLRLPS
jgi:hypothetical protein